MTDTSTITISKAEYEYLISEEMFLQCLRRHGVDNWEGFDDAVDTYNEWEESREESR